MKIKKGDLLAKMNIKVNITKTDGFEKMVSLLKEVLSDARIDEGIRSGYIIRLGKLLDMIEEDNRTSIDNEIN